MATLTPNYNLSKPEATDNFSAFRQSYNDNMDIIDANLGGGGGGSYTAGDGIKITGSTISLEYLSVVSGKVCIVYDDGN